MSLLGKSVFGGGGGRVCVCAFTLLLSALLIYATSIRKGHELCISLSSHSSRLYNADTTERPIFTETGRNILTDLAP